MRQPARVSVRVMPVAVAVEVALLETVSVYETRSPMLTAAVVLVVTDRSACGGGGVVASPPW